MRADADGIFAHPPNGCFGARDLAEVELWSGYHSYECECRSCQGDGIIIKPGGETPCQNCNGSGKTFIDFSRYPSVPRHGINIQARYAELIINEPNLQLYADDEKGMLCFKSGDQYGAIMKTLE